jgi:cytochrome c oxidase subunit III
MNGNATLDVSHLPAIGFGPRAPIWLGQVGMMLIEGTLFAVLLACYAYVASGSDVWPPPGVGTPDFWIPTIALVVLLASCIPMYLGGEAAMRKDWTGVIVWTLVNMAMAVVFLVLRTIELNRLDFKWTSHIYGSIVWCVMGLHTMHAIADTCESAVIVAAIAMGWRREKQQLAVKVDGIYWYFVAGVWIPFYFLFYIYPRLIRG